MESEPHMQLDLPYCIPTVIDGIPSQQLSESSHLRTTFFQQNAQNDSMLGFPLLPSLQVQSFKDIHDDRTVNCGGLVTRGSFEELCLRGPTFATDSLPISDANTSANIQYEVPSASPKPMFSGGSSYASSSSIPTALTCHYNGAFGGSNYRWDNNISRMQHNMNWRVSDYELERIRFSESEDAKNEWILPSSDNVCSRHTYAENSASHNELSLSLATCSPSLPSDLSCSGVVHSSKSEANDSSHCRKELSLGCTSNSRSMSVKFSPITSGAKYVSVLQQILSEISSYSLDSLDKTSCNGDDLVNPSSNLQFSSNQLFDPTSSFKLSSSEFRDYDVSREVAAGSSKKSQMLALLQMVDDQYNRCLDEIHMVISAFHAATDLEPQLHSCFALQTISFFYKNLRERISSQILAMGVYNESGRDTGISIDKSFIQKQWTLQQLKKKDQLWRPQRGLPERSVAVLRAWMFDNFLHPYPKDAEKHLLAIKSGLTRSQVSNWFINARVRLWKPLVEEMCAELHRRKSGRQNDEGTNNSDNSGRQLSIYNHNKRFNK